MSSYGEPLPTTRDLRLRAVVVVAVAAAAAAATVALSDPWPHGAAAANILGVFPIEAPSHHVVFDAYMSALHRRGHNVTVYTQFPDTGSEAYRRIRIDGATPLDPDLVTMDRMYSPSALHSYAHMFATVARGEAYTRSEALRELGAQPADAYDLIVTETCNTDLYLALAERFAAPFVAWTTSPMFVWSAVRVAATSHPAYVPVLMTAHGARMGFAERARNTVARSVAFYEYYTRSDRVSQRIATARYGPASTPLGRLALRTSFLFVDTHHTVWGSRPLPRNVVEVGGLHIGPPTPLSEDIQKFIDEAEHGVIYFCMGSLLRGETFPAEKRQMFLNVFSKIPQRVLWKWEGELPGKPSNVMIRKWMPQRDILAHPNVKLFISHGGLLGSTEAVYEGVPILSIPMFGDQMTNIKAIMDKGAAEMMIYTDLNEDEIFTKVKSMLTNPIYKQKAKELSEAFRDRPMSPLETAVYWTEYVIRHKGAPHLRSAAVGMPWYQYYLIDVLLVILLTVATVILLLYYLIFKVILRSIKKNSKEKQT